MLMNRRDLLRAGGVLVVSFVFDTRAGRAFAVQPGAGKPVDLGEVDSFLAFHANGTVTLYTSKVDVGTGLRIPAATAEQYERPLCAGQHRVHLFKIA